MPVLGVLAATLATSSLNGCGTDDAVVMTPLRQSGRSVGTPGAVGALDWGLNAQQAASMIAFGAANSVTTNVGGEHPNVNIVAPVGGIAGDSDAWVSGLRALGHTVSVVAQSSGIGTITKLQRSGATVLEGGADPPREVLTLGDTFKP